jgi:cytochrome c biogenesis protein CcmG/thiol:disulfide interchange protein DsbE
VDEPVVGTRLRWTLRLLAISAITGLFVLLGWATLTAGSGQRLVARVAAGELPRAPEFELEVIWPRTDTWPRGTRSTLGDGRLALSELRGRPVVINFWASWCGPCRDEAPILRASAEAHAGRVVFLGIDIQDLEGDALSFLREFDVPFVSARDGSNGTYDEYGLTGVPETYYVDGRGRIVAHTPGPVSRTTLEDGIADLLEQ